MLTGDLGAECFDAAPKVRTKRASSSLRTTILTHESRQSKSNRSFDNSFVECANSLTNLASTKLLIKDRREIDFEKFDITMTNHIVESFEGVHKRRKLMTLL